MNSEIQQNLWGKVFPDGVRKRKEQAQRGWIPQGVAFDGAENSQLLSLMGDFSSKVISIADPQGLSLVPEQIAIAGGWCALRTKDMESFKPEVGTLLNPISGIPEKITSVQQVCNWIVQSVAFDQIIESIGAVNASEYVAISERKLWSSRIVEKLAKIFSRNLTSKETQAIEDAVEFSDKIKALLTERYLKYVLKKKLSIKCIVDEDIWSDLKTARDEMLANSGISIATLQQEFPDDTTVQNTSLVWTMYTQPYFDMLREKGIINHDIAVVVEPSHHAFVETRTEAYIARRIFDQYGRYFNPEGFNSTTGFIAFIECLDGKGQNVRKTLSIDSVPNISNWKNLFLRGGLLTPERNLALNPADNLLFLWGLNFIPFGNVQKALLGIVALQNEFKRQKDVLNNQYTLEQRKDSNVRQSMQQKIDELRQELLRELTVYNDIIARELQSFFSYITKGIL